MGDERAVRLVDLYFLSKPVRSVRSTLKNVPVSGMIHTKTLPSVLPSPMRYSCSVVSVSEPFMQYSVSFFAISRFQRGISVSPVRAIP